MPFKFTSDQSLADWLTLPESQEIMKKTPHMVTTAAPSSAVRFYWFGIHTEVDGSAWKLGANLHFDGNIGGTWVTRSLGKTNHESFEVHPHKAVVNPAQQWMAARLRVIAKKAEQLPDVGRPQGTEKYEKGHLTF
jgi:hypothetical protein